jgi:DNA polymerase-3 subunit epsilon
MAQMIALAVRVVPLVCATRLEAQVRETRLIAERQPPFNRRSRHPERAAWLALTTEAFPRLTTVRQVRPSSRGDTAAPTYIGPFGGTRAAQRAAEALLEAIPLRTCTQRLSARHADPAAGCLLAEIDRCLAPCRDLSVAADYQVLADQARIAMATDVEVVVVAVERRMRDLVAAERYEEAADWRDRLHDFVAGAHRAQQMSLLSRTPHLVAARVDRDHSWEVHVIRFGRLAAAGRCPAGEAPGPLVASLVALAEDVPAPHPPEPAGLLEEARLIQAWLDSPGVRLVQAPPMALPVHAGGRQAHALDLIRRDVQAHEHLARDARR